MKPVRFYPQRNDDKHAMTLSEIAAELGVSKQYASQLEKIAIRKFKQRFIKAFPDANRMFLDDIRTGRW